MGMLSTRENVGIPFAAMMSGIPGSGPAERKHSASEVTVARGLMV